MNLDPADVIYSVVDLVSRTNDMHSGGYQGLVT